MATVDGPRTKKSLLSKEKQSKTIGKDGGIQVQDILSHCQETNVDRVFEIDMHALKLTKIENCQNFPKLRILDISCNQIKCIRGLEKNLDLRELKLYSNAITKMEGLAKSKELCSLHLQDNKLTSINNGLQNLKKLKVLRLDGNQIQSITMTELAACSKLMSVNISRNKIQDISFVNCLPLLEELYASHNNIKKIPDLGRCKNLTELDLSYNQITSVSGLSSLPAITVVELEHNFVSHFDVSGTLKTVEQLHLKNNQLKHLKKLSTQFPSLELLDVSSNTLARLEEVCCLLESCDTLRELSVCSNPCTSGDILYHQTLVRTLPQLEILDGVPVKRPQSAAGKNRPPMRPVSASQMLSTKHLEEQVTMATREQESFESLISSKFDIVYDLLKKLPVKEEKSSVDIDSFSTPVSSHSPWQARPLKSGAQSPLRTDNFSRSKTENTSQNLPSTNTSRPGSQDSQSAKTLRLGSPVESGNLPTFNVQESDKSYQLAGTSRSGSSPLPATSSRPGTQESDQSPRPGSRCGNRARIQDAMAFAEENINIESG